MKPKVYLETTIVSYLTARPSRDPILAANLKQTAEWEREESHKFDLLVSDLVIAEASEGDPAAVARRLAAVKDIPMLLTDENARALARFIGDSMIFADQGGAGRLACRHRRRERGGLFADMELPPFEQRSFQTETEALCLAKGYKCPVICTPAELMED